MPEQHRWSRMSRARYAVSSPLISHPAGGMPLARRQPVSPAASLNILYSICTQNGVYTKFGIDPYIPFIMTTFSNMDYLTNIDL